MLYSRCVYLVMLRADEVKRNEYRISRATVLCYIRHACAILACDIQHAAIGEGYVLMLVDINPELSVEGLVKNVARWTSSWITDGCDNYWTDDCRMREVSPEDIIAAKGWMDFLVKSHDYAIVAEKCGLHRLDDIADVSACHHIILLTSRSRLLVPEKYVSLLSQLTSDTVRDLGYRIVACGARRNHVHILCYVPYDMSISGFIDLVKLQLLENMHNNLHFHRFESFDDDTIAFTVAAKRVARDEHDILSQDVIHLHQGVANEMSYIYRRIGITFVTSLH